MKYTGLPDIKKRLHSMLDLGCSGLDQKIPDGMINRLPTKII